MKLPQGIRKFISRAKVKLGFLYFEDRSDRYDLGRGQLWLRFPHRTSFNPAEVEFLRPGSNNPDDLRDKQSAEVSTSTFTGSPDDAIAWGKAIIKAGQLAKVPISKKEIRAAQARIKAERDEKERLDNIAEAARSRRELTWGGRTGSDNLTKANVFKETNGLFRIIPNRAPHAMPRYREQTYRWLVLGPQHNSRDERWYGEDGERERPIIRKKEDHWRSFKIENVYRSLKEAKRGAEGDVKRMLDKGLVEEIGKSGRLRLTDKMKKRMSKAPLAFLRIKGGD